MSTTEEANTTKDPNPLVKALQRKTNHQKERIDELEETIHQLQVRIEVLEQESAEVTEE